MYMEFFGSNADVIETAWWMQAKNGWVGQLKQAGMLRCRVVLLNLDDAIFLAYSCIGLKLPFTHNALQMIAHCKELHVRSNAIEKFCVFNRGIEGLAPVRNAPFVIFLEAQADNLQPHWAGKFLDFQFWTLNVKISDFALEDFDGFLPRSLEP